MNYGCPYDDSYCLEDDLCDACKEDRARDHNEARNDTFD